MNTKTTFSFLARTATLVRAAGARVAMTLLLLLVTSTTAWADADLIIRSTADWNTFANNVSTGTDNYAGKVVMLAADISVSTMAGDDRNNWFYGTFDGCGHTLTINLTGGYSGTAPFRRIYDATIKNLNVTGTITTTYGMAGSIAFVTNGITHISNCLSTVTITGKGKNTDGGLVSCNNGELHFTNCAFKGKMLGDDSGCGGFVGWNNSKIFYNSCLFAPSQVGMSTNNSATFNRDKSDATSTFDRCYYTQAFGTEQGTSASGMSNETLVSNLGSGWEIRNGNVVPKKPLTYLAYHTATHSFAELTVVNPTIVGASTTTMGAAGTETWYMVSSDVTISSRITVNGTVHLILADGKTLTASQGITVSSGNTLNIYGQTAGTGALNATGVKVGGDGTESAAIGSVGGPNNVFGSVNIHGGHITADGAGWSAGIGGGVNSGGGSVAIYGGTVSATGHDGNSEAIGHGSSGGTVGKTLADGLRVTTGSNTTPVAYSSRESNLGQKVVTVEPCTEHNLSNNVCTYCGLSYYGVTYNGNNATSGTVPVDNTIYLSNETVTVLGNTGSLVRTGYIFGGWNTQADGLGTTYTAGTTFTINGSTTLYAKWTPITYTVRFHKNDGGEDEFTDQAFTYDVAQTLTANAFTREGYDFMGWCTTTDGTVAYTDGQSVSNLANVQGTVFNLYAKWAIPYTITYDLDGGTVATPNPTTYYEHSTAITLNNPTRYGYTFIGWTGTGLAEATMTVTIAHGSTGNRSYTATWTETQLTLANNADNDDVISATNGERHDVILSGRTLYKDGDWNTLCLPFALASFKGTPLEDATVKTLTSSSFEDGTLTMTFSANLTRIAAGVPYIVKWKYVDLSTLTADYTAQNGETLTGTLGGNYKISIAAGAKVTLKDVTINGTNSYSYSWAGINCVGNATIILKGTNTVKGFYANYPGIHVPKDKTLTIKGDGSLNASSGGAAGIGGGDYIDCGNITITGGTVNATGSRNAAGIGGGWNAWCGNITITDGVTSVTANKGGDAPRSIGAGYNGWCGTVTIGGVVGAITQSPYTYTGTGSGSVSLSDNIVNPVFTNVTISSTTANVSTTYADFIGSYAPFNDNSLLLDTNNPDGDAMHAAISINRTTRDGYTFGGWYTDAGITTPVTTIPFAADGTVALYGKWTPITYTVRLHKNDGGEDEYTDQGFTYDVAQTLASGFTRTDYYLTGWAETPDGSVVYTDGESVVNLATEQGKVINLYAVWTESRTLFAEGRTNQWMTWCDDDVWSVAATPIKVFTVSSISGATVILTEVANGIVPANTPVLIQRTDNSTTAITVLFSAEGTAGTGIATSEGTGCTLFGNPTDATITTGSYFAAGRSYVLYGDKFLLVDTNDGIAAHRCMLTLAAPANARSLNIVIAGDAAGISATLNDKGEMINDTWYTLDGRKLHGKPAKKGVYIYNGKKTVIK